MSDIEDFVTAEISELEARLDEQLAAVLNPVMFLIEKNMEQIALLRQQIAGKADVDVRSEEEGVNRVDPDEEAASTPDQ